MSYVITTISVQLANNHHNRKIENREQFWIDCNKCWTHIGEEEVSLYDMKLYFELIQNRQK